MSKMFAFDPADYAATFAAKGYVHIPGGLAAEFHRLLVGQVEAVRQANRLKEWAIGDKQQSLYEFPAGHDYRRELCECVGQVTGLDGDSLVISERHIKDYEAGAAPNPVPHKDRYATEVAVGFAVNVSPQSALVFYPFTDVGLNHFNTAAEFRASLSEDKSPERVLMDAPRIEFHDRAGDVFMFHGNSIWHTRTNPAHTTMLYFKMNSFHCDPLGEDPLTPAIRSRTADLLTLPDAELAKTVPVMGRRVDYIHQRFNRQWQQVAGVVLWGEKHLTVDHEELSALRLMDGLRNLGAVLSESAAPDKLALLGKLRRLAARGVVDLRTRVESSVALVAPVASVTGAPALPALV
jgi:hypothetical protein